MITDINSEDRQVQQTFGPNGTLGRMSERDVVLVRDLRAALERLNPDLPASAREQAIEKLTRIDFARSLVQHNREFYGFIRTGVPVEWRDAAMDETLRDVQPRCCIDHVRAPGKT